MTLRIQCPACQRQFKVNEELKSRTVECGACEKQFVVNDDAIVHERERFFPGDNKKPGLDHYGRAPSSSNTPQVQFATANYNESATAADVIPPAAQRLVAGVVGTVILALYVVVLMFGSQSNGLLSDMEREKRIILSAFIALVGTALVCYGGVRRRKLAALGGVGLAFLVVVLSIVLPQSGSGDAPSLSGSETPIPPIEDQPEEEKTKFSEAEARVKMGYEPVERAIERIGFDSVVALWVPSMGLRFRYQVQRYLQRKIGTGERPAFYTRGKGGLIVIEGTELKMAEIVPLVERFARVDDQYVNLRVLRIVIEGKHLLEPSADYESKLNDKTHESYLALNRAELDHIDIDRVKDAAQRLASVAPSRFRPQIADKLVELLEEGTDFEFRTTVCNAIMVWSVPDEGAEAVVARVAEELIAKGERMPRNMIRFLVSRRYPDANSLLKRLWEDKPIDWETTMLDSGSEIESVVLPHILNKNAAVQRSALVILRRVGTESSLADLRKALETANEDNDLKHLIEQAIQGILEEDPEPAPAPSPEPGPVPEPAPAPTPTPGATG